MKKIILILVLINTFTFLFANDSSNLRVGVKAEIGKETIASLFSCEYLLRKYIPLSIDADIAMGFIARNVYGNAIRLENDLTKLQSIDIGIKSYFWVQFK